MELKTNGAVRIAQAYQQGCLAAWDVLTDAAAQINGDALLHAVDKMVVALDMSSLNDALADTIPGYVPGTISVQVVIKRVHNGPDIMENYTMMPLTAYKGNRVIATYDKELQRLFCEAGQHMLLWPFMLYEVITKDTDKPKLVNVGKSHEWYPEWEYIKWVNEIKPKQ